MDEEEIQEFIDALYNESYLELNGSEYVNAILLDDAIRILKEVLRVDE